MLGMALSACSSQQVQTADASSVVSNGQPAVETASANSAIDTTNDTTDADTANSQPKAVAGQFTEDELNALLIAEFAGQREDFNLARQKYMEVAASAGSGTIAMRAMQIAQYTGDTNAALKAAQLWTQAEPDNEQAHWHLAQLYLAKQEFANALTHLNRIHELTGNDHYELLATAAANSSEDSRYELQSLLMERSQQDPDNPSLWTALAILNQSLGLDGIAEQQFDQALSIDPQQISAAVFKARMLAESNRTAEALDWINHTLEQHPGHKGLQVMRARLLLNMGPKFSDHAYRAFAELHQQYPEDQTLLLSLGLLEFDTQRIDAARNHLRLLLDGNSHRNQALFYLGRLEEQTGNPQQALEYFVQITKGREFIPAQLNAANIIIQTNGLDSGIIYLKKLRKLNAARADELMALEANLLLDYRQYDGALERFNLLLDKAPDNASLLFSRALVWEKLQNLEQMEADLRRVIELEPENSEALNALGYTLVDRLDRAEEALPMLQKAASLNPESAPIIDSLGWAYFKLGDYESAAVLLGRAHQLLLDDEIAAHYGEALWMLGKTGAANQVWLQGYKENPNSQILDDTLKRHGLKKDQL